MDDKREALRKEDPIDLYDLLLDVMNDEEIEHVAEAIIHMQRAQADELWYSYAVIKDDIDVRVEAVRSGHHGKQAKLSTIRSLEDKARNALAAAIDAEQRYDTLVERYGQEDTDE